jgi:hypothetical protein
LLTLLGKRHALVAALVALGALALPTASSASATHWELTCGRLPGEGFYAFTKTVDIGCRAGDLIAFKAHRKFCRHHNHCRFGIHTSPLHVYRGRVAFHRWLCRVRSGYELTEDRCRRGRQRILYSAGA